MSAELPRPIQLYVRRFVARGRRLALVRALGFGLLCACCWVIVGCLLDRIVALPRGVRLAWLLIAGALATGPVVRPLLRALRRRVDWVRAAEAIESASPAFGQRLCTVVSQSLERDEHRGSAEMLERLAADVALEASAGRPGWWLGWGKALRPWGLVLIVTSTAMVVGLAVGAPDAVALLRRIITPLAGVPPVTTTRIWVEPGATTLLRGEALAVRARAENLGEGVLEIFTTADGQSWSRLPMVAVSESEFIFNFPAVEQDLSYYVAGGDAQSEKYRVSVLRRPAVAELRVRYEFPSYTGRPPLTTTVTDGQVEALAGTKMTLTLVSTEPLREAALSVGGSRPERLVLAPTSDPRVVQGEMTVRRNMVAELSMTSVAGQAQRLERALTIRAQVDREPIARLLQPAGDLRLQPRDLLEIRYQFMDDYALIGAGISVQINTQAATQVPLPLSGDRRAQQGQYVLDLATLKVKVGDVVSVSAVAQDGAGKRVVRDTRQVLIAPRSIDAATYQFIAELRRALEHVAGLQKEVDEGAAAADAARRPGGDPVPHRLKVTRALGASVEAALLVHQSLLRACPRCPVGATGDALADAADKARVALWSAERLATLDADGGREPAVAQGLKDLSQSVKLLAAGLKVLADGQQASAVLIDRHNLAPLRAGALAERLKETLRRAEEDLAAAVESMGLRAGEANLQDRLQRRVNTAAEAVRAARVIDFEPAARQWAEAVASREPIAPPLAERLASASTVEALRPDGDPVRARDLQLASRAATRLASAPTDHLESVLPALRQFAAAIHAVQAEHRLGRDSPASSASERQGVSEVAAAARQKFEHWAQQLFEWPPARGPATAGVSAPDEVALDATAQMARHSFLSARASDQRLATSPEAREELSRRVDAAESIDRASAGQKELAEKTVGALSEADAVRLEASQRQLAQGMPGSARPTADSRQQGLAVVQRGQAQLALMPQRLTAALASAQAVREANALAEQARREAAAAPPARKPMAQRAADLAASAAKDAQRRLSTDVTPLAPASVQQLLKDLGPYHPEATEAIQAMGERLLPALSALQQSLRNDGPSDIETAAQQVRSALELVQSHLAAAQTRLLERDPAVAARFYAHAAAQALALRPPDFPKARRHQESTLEALNRAWLENLRAANQARLELAPGFRQFLHESAPDPAAGPARSSQGIVDVVPGIREWGFLPPRPSDASAAPGGETDPAGYHEALRLYFEALNKAKEPAK